VIMIQDRSESRPSLFLVTRSGASSSLAPAPWRRCFLGGDGVVKKVLLTSALVMSGVAAGFALAQAAAQTGREPQFENPEVKVWKSVILPGSKRNTRMEDRPCVLTACERAGHAPSGVNVGDRPMEVMVVELQNAN
jgi:hypothetical protein